MESVPTRLSSKLLQWREFLSLVSLNVNINDEKDLRPSAKTHPINTNNRPRQLSPFNDQLPDFRKPPTPSPPLVAEIRQLITKKTSDDPLVDINEMLI